MRTVSTAKRFIIIAAVCALAAPAVAACLLAVSILRYGNVHDPRPADAAVVLGAAVWHNEPSPVYRERIHHALSLYRAGRVKKIILTGAADSPNERPAAEVGRAYAVTLGAPASDVLVETSSRTTEENICLARDLSASEGLATILIVSDPIHMRRAMTVAEDAGLDARPAPTPTSRFRSVALQSQFLLREVRYYAAYLAARAFGYAPCRR